MNAPLPFSITDRLDAEATHVCTLPNGVRVVSVDLPHLQTAAVSVFIRSGSQHESRRLNGISHVVEHMAFKGTTQRSCQQINSDAERLGAEVNAHTDKDHTAFHIHGLARDAGAFVRMLGDIIRNGTYPEDELERERRVILQEYDEDADDAVSAGFKLFDRLCFGPHPFGRPVIGSRANIERFSRDELVAYVREHYTAANIVIGVAGGVDHEVIARAAEEAFGSLAAGHANAIDPPQHIGGIGSRAFAGYSQAHVVVGFPVASLREDHDAALVAAALFGEGMSSPLLDELRERRGMLYHAACSADISEACGQFVIEASTTPERLDELFGELVRLLGRQASGVAADDLQRARNQILVRSLRASERAAQRVEAAAQDLFSFGRVRSRSELLDRLAAVDARQVEAVFESMLATRPRHRRHRQGRPSPAASGGRCLCRTGGAVGALQLPEPLQHQSFDEFAAGGALGGGALVLQHRFGDLVAVQHEGAHLRLGQREAECRKDLCVIGDAARIGFVDRLPGGRVAPRPGADRQLDACRTRRRAAAKRQRDDVAQLLARITGSALEAVRQLLGRALAPGLQDAPQQIVAVAEMPVEAAAGDAQARGQPIDPHMVDALVDQHVRRSVDPALGRQRGCACRIAVGPRAATWARLLGHGHRC